MGWRPQFAFQTPAGYRDEPYEVPFSFVVQADGQVYRSLPWQLDDDQPYLIRAVVFPEIGTAQNPALFPALCRITDTHGNPLSQGLVLALGVWSQSGFSSINAFGFPLADEVECAPGGVLLFDFQLNTNATIAFFAHTGAVETIEFDAAVFGTAGNAFSIQLINPGAANVPLSVAVVAGAVQVTLATNGASAITSTFQDVANIINSTPAAAAVMSAQLSGANPVEVITAFGPSSLAGGAASTSVPVNGTILGVKRFKEC